MNASDSTVHDPCASSIECAYNQHCVWGVISYDYKVCDCRFALVGTQCDEVTAETILVWMNLGFLVVLSIHSAILALREMLISFIHCRLVSSSISSQRRSSRKRSSTEVIARYVHVIAFASHISLARMLIAEIMMLVVATERKKDKLTLWINVSVLSFAMLAIFSMALGFLMIGEWMKTLASATEYSWLLRRRRLLIRFALLNLLITVVTIGIGGTNYAGIIGFPLAALLLICTRIYGRKLANMLSTYARAMSEKQQQLQKVDTSSQSRLQIADSFRSWSAVTNQHDKYLKVSTLMYKTTRHAEAALLTVLIVSVLHILYGSLNNARISLVWITILYSYAQTGLHYTYQHYLSSQYVVHEMTMRQLFKLIKQHPRLLLPFNYSSSTSNWDDRRTAVRKVSHPHKQRRSLFKQNRRMTAPTNDPLERNFSTGELEQTLDNSAMIELELTQVRRYTSFPDRFHPHVRTVRKQNHAYDRNEMRVTDVTQPPRRLFQTRKTIPSPSNLGRSRRNVLGNAHVMLPASERRSCYSSS